MSEKKLLLDEASKIHIIDDDDCEESPSASALEQPSTSDAETSAVVKDFKLIETINDDGSLDYELVKLDPFPDSDAENLQHNSYDYSIMDPFDSDSPAKRPKKKKRNSKSATKTSTTARERPVTEANFENMALPQFTITNNHQSDMEDDGNGTNLYMGDSDDISPRQKVKTMSVSAIKLCGNGTEKDKAYLQNLDKLCATPSDDNTSIYKCKYCPKAFASPYHLMIHTRKSHVCQHCLEAFEKPTELYKHVREKHNSFDCLLCGRVFRSNSNLRQHMRKTHSIYLPAHVSLLEVKSDNK